MLPLSGAGSGPIKATAAAVAPGPPKKADIMKMTQGTSFNKTLTESALNTSNSKQSFAFSKAKRFGDVITNDQGYAVSVLGAERERERLKKIKPILSPPPTSFKTTAASYSHVPRSRLPRNINQQSGKSLGEQQLLIRDMENGYDDENADGEDEQDDYGQQDENEDANDQSNVDSQGNVEDADRNGNSRAIMNSDMQHYALKGGKMSSMDGSVVRRQ